MTDLDRALLAATLIGKVVEVSGEESRGFKHQVIRVTLPPSPLLPMLLRRDGSEIVLTGAPMVIEEGDGC